MAGSVSEVNTVEMVNGQLVAQDNTKMTTEWTNPDFTSTTSYRLDKDLLSIHLNLL